MFKIEIMSKLKQQISEILTSFYDSLITIGAEIDVPQEDLLNIFLNRINENIRNHLLLCKSTRNLGSCLEFS